MSLLARRFKYDHQELKMNMLPVMLVMPVSTTHHQGCGPDNKPNRGEITLACKPVP